MSLSKITGVGNYQMFENITSLPSEFIKTLKDIQLSAMNSQSAFTSINEVTQKLNTFGDLSQEKLEKLSSFVDRLLEQPSKDKLTILTIFDNIKKHPAGLLANVVSMMRAHDITAFITQLVSLMSLLGFEGPVIEAVRNRWENIDISSQKVSGRFESYDKLPKLLCLLVTVLGPMVGGHSVTDFAAYIRKTKKDAEVYKSLIEELEDLAEEHGFGFSSRAKFVATIKVEFEECVAHIADFEKYLSISPIRFCRKDTYELFQQVGKKLQEFVKQLATKSFSDFVGTTLGAEIRILHHRYNTIAQNVERIRRTNAERVKPVGVCLYGVESQIGKSHMMSHLEKLVKLEMKRRYEVATKLEDGITPEDPVLQAFGDISLWSTWNQNMRDGYDQNFNGQQIHAIDDAFSSKEELEHQSLINFISNRPVPSYQAELASKGIAYECRMVMVSCNMFPRDSKKITNIHALAERFPVFIHCTKKPGATIPESGYDTSFNWMDLHLSSGSDYFHKRGPKCDKQPSCYNCMQGVNREIKLPEIAEYVCDLLYTNQQRFNQVQDSLNDGVYETSETFYDCKTDLPRFCSLLSNLEGWHDLNLFGLPSYEGWDDLPSDVKKGILSSRQDQVFVGMYRDTQNHLGTYASTSVSGSGKLFIDLKNLAKIDFEHFIVLYFKYKFQPIPAYERVVTRWFAETKWYGPDNKFLIINNRMYYNDCITIPKAHLKGDPHRYIEEVAPTWSAMFKMYCSTEYMAIGACFSGLLFLGIPGAIALPIMVMGITCYAYDDKVPEQENLSVMTELMQKLIMVFGLWVVAKIFIFIGKGVKGLMAHNIWKSHPKEAKIILGTYENSSVTFIRGNLNVSLKDNTIVLVDETGVSQYGHHGALALGEIKTITWKGYVTVHLLCCKRANQVDTAALARALNTLDVSEIFIRVQEVTEDVRLCLEENGAYTKNIVYTASGSQNHYFGTTRMQRAKAPTSELEFEVPPISVEKLLEQYDQEYPNATPEQRESTRKLYQDLSKKNDKLNQLLSQVKSYEESGQKQRNRRDQVQVRPFRQQNNNRLEDSGHKERNRRPQQTVRSYRDKRFETYDGTTWRQQSYEAKSTAKSKFLADCSGKEIESDFSESDYLPTEPELDEVRFESCKSSDIPLESDKAIRYPNMMALTVHTAQERITKGRFETAVDPNANALLTSIRKNYLVKLTNVATGASLYGNGIGNHVIFPSHLVYGVGDLVTIKKMDGLVPQKETYLGRVIHFKKEWEIASLRICLPSDPDCKRVEGISKDALTFKLSLRSHVPLDCDVGAQSYVKYTLQYLPNQGMIIPSMAQYVKKYEGVLSGVKVSTSIYAMRTLPFMNAQTVPGDCGGAVVMLNAKSTRKLLGFHIGSASNVLSGELSTSYGLVAILTQDRIDVLTDNQYVSVGNFHCDQEIQFASPSKYDNFETLYQSPDTFGIHMPVGEEGAFTYLGDMYKRQLPCDIYGRTDHHTTPFTGVFPIRKVPTVLLDHLVEDQSVLKQDADGNPSIIVTQLAGYGDKHYTIDQTEMDDMVNQMTDHMELMLEGSAITTARKHKTALYEAINGQTWNDDFDKINDKTSPGIPWSDYAPKKVNYLAPVRIIDPYRTSSEDKYVMGNYLKKTEEGEMLTKVFNTKLEAAKRNLRTVSIWKVCLKDEVQNVEKVKIGKTRAFIAPPMESFLLGRYLFGRWKAAFKAAQFNMFHAIGIDMKSLDVTRLAEELGKHPNYIDMDYKNFDQRLLAQFMWAAGKIISKCIERRDVRLNTPEETQRMYNARMVYFDEVIRTILCANRTVFLTSHGNKSGNPLTTEMNCIVNVLYSWHVFRTVTGMKALYDYRKHVVDINFGDDKVLSISDEVIEKFNFMSYKKIMADLGQIVTPGTKSDIEIACTRNIEEISFLKRNLININANIWIAPLDQRSIESVFNYSSLSEEEVEEWQSTIFEQQIEAMLWGREYYVKFMKQLRAKVMTRQFRREYPQLKEAILGNMLLTFDHIVTQYFVRIGLLDPMSLTKETITYENGKVSYSSGKIGITTSTSYQGNYQSEINKDNNNKQKQININSITTSEDSVMETIKSAIQYVGSKSRTLKLRQGNADPEEMAPEGPAQYQKVQSDVGPPVKINCADGVIMAFPLAQSDDYELKGFNIPRGAQKQYSLPDELKHFTEQEQFSLTDVTPVKVISPNLKAAAPKAAVISQLFSFNRAKMTIMCLNCRPPMGFAQTIKVAVTAPGSTDESVINRKGVTYDLADNPKMYFLIPYCDRSFMQENDDPWFKVIIQQITGPVAADTVPDPLYIRPSFEVHEMDYYVHQLPTNRAEIFTGRVATDMFVHDIGDSDYVISVPRPMYINVVASDGTFCEVKTSVGTLLRREEASGFTSSQSELVYYEPGQYRITSDYEEGIKINIGWASLFNEPPVILDIPPVRRKQQQRRTPVRTTKKVQRHIRASEILDHPTDFTFEKMYLASKGKHGFTLPGHRYEGPGNSMNNGEPTTETDAYARKHDLQYAWASYLKSQGKLGEEAFAAKIHAADEELARNANLTSLDGISAWVGMRAKMFVEHFTGLLYPANGSVGHYQCEEETMQKMNYVHQLKELADKEHVDVKYNFNRLVSPDHEPIFECVCIYGEGEKQREINSFGIGKRAAKQAAAELMLTTGRYESDFDSAAAEPSVSMDTRPPVGQAIVNSNLAMGKTVGNSEVNIGIVKDDFIPIETYNVASATPQIFKMRIAPGNFTSSGAESQAQQPFRNHLYSGPVQDGRDLVYCTFKVTTAANFQQNARMIVAHVPLSYTAAQVAALSAYDLKQFPNREHKLHGTETIFSPQWINRFPVIENHGTGETNTNGWLVCNILEDSLSTSSTAPKLTLWVCSNKVAQSFGVTPSLPAPITT